MLVLDSGVTENAERSSENIKPLIKEYFYDSIPFLIYSIAFLIIGFFILFAEWDYDPWIELDRAIRDSIRKIVFLLSLVLFVGVYTSRILKPIFRFLDMKNPVEISKDLIIASMSSDYFDAKSYKHYTEFNSRAHRNRYGYYAYNYDMLTCYRVDERICSEEEMDKIWNDLEHGKKYKFTYLKYSRIVTSITSEDNPEKCWSVDNMRAVDYEQRKKRRKKTEKRNSPILRLGRSAYLV